MIPKYKKIYSTSFTRENYIETTFLIHPLGKSLKNWQSILQVILWGIRHYPTLLVRMKNDIATMERNLEIYIWKYILFTTGNRVISIFKSNQIRKSITETPETIQKTHP